MKAFINDLGCPLVLMAFVICVLAVLFTCSGKGLNKRRAECEAKGGVFYYSRDGEICLKKDAVIWQKQ